MAQFEILGHAYPSKKVFIESVRGLLDHMAEGQDDGTAEAFIRRFLTLHPRYDEKTKGRSFRLHVARGRHITLHLDDGDIVTIKWTFLDNRTDHQKVTYAAREAVSGQRPTQRPRKGYVCPKCGDPFLLRDFLKFDWDHHPKEFADIWADWLTAEGLSEDEVEIDGKRFADPVLEQRWADYHYSETHDASGQPTGWRALHKRCN